MNELISGQKLIEELENLDKYFVEALPLNSETVFIAGEVRELIESQPPADQWIPCSDPPKESGYYMACIYDSEVDNYDFRKTWFAHVDDYNMEESEWRELYDYETVTAWQPLPKPYKGGMTK